MMRNLHFFLTKVAFVHKHFNYSSDLFTYNAKYSKHYLGRTGDLSPRIGIAC